MFGGALVCANKNGDHGGARHGLSFSYSHQGPGDLEPQIAHAINVDEDICDLLVSHQNVYVVRGDEQQGVEND